MEDVAPETAAEATGASSAGIFTASQAEVGEQTFDEVCSACHSDREFQGSEFMFSWGRRSARDFYRVVARTMPDDAPASLTTEQYVNILAYVLQMNDFPVGSMELTADEDMLSQHRLSAHAPEN